jgi:hypothetical protein
MSKHVIIELDPAAQYEWNRCSVRGLFSCSDIDLKQLVQQELTQPGHYLAKLTVAVEVVEFKPLQEPEAMERESEASQERQDYSVPFAANF